MSHKNLFNQLDLKMFIDILSFLIPNASTKSPNDIILSDASLVYILTFRPIYEQAMSQLKLGRKLKTSISYFLNSAQQYYWLIQLGALPSYHTLYNNAAITGNILIVQQLRQNISSQYLFQKIIPLAIENNHINVVNYIHHITGIPFDIISVKFCLRYAAERGNLIYFEYLIKQWDEKDNQFLVDLYEIALIYQKIQIVQFIHNNYLCENILNHYHKFVERCINKGNLLSLKWLYEQGYQFQSCAWTCAVLSKQIDVVKWLNSLIPRPPFDDYSDLYADAMHNQDRDMFQYLLTIGLPYPVSNFVQNRATGMGYFINNVL